MLRPSRPMMRPFMSSEGSWTTDTVVSAAWLGGEALHRDREDRAHAALGVALGLLLDLADDAGRVVARLVLDVLEERAAWPGRRSGRRRARARATCSARSSSSSARSALELAVARRRARARAARPPRLRRSSERSSDCGAAALRMSCGAHLAQLPASRVAGRSATPLGARRRMRRRRVDDGGRDDPGCQDHRRDHEFHCRVPLRRPRARRPARCSPGSWSDGPTAGERTNGDGSAARRPRFSGAASVRESGSTDALVRLGLSRCSVGLKLPVLGTA